MVTEDRNYNKNEELKKKMDALFQTAREEYNRGLKEGFKRGLYTGITIVLLIVLITASIWIILNLFHL